MPFRSLCLSLPRLPPEFKSGSYLIRTSQQTQASADAGVARAARAVLDALAESEAPVAPQEPGQTNNGRLSLTHLSGQGAGANLCACAVSAGRGTSPAIQPQQQHGPCRYLMPQHQRQNTYMYTSHSRTVGPECFKESGTLLIKIYDILLRL